MIYLPIQLGDVAVFPLAPGKKVPLKGSRGFLDAAPLDAWHEHDWPEGMNVGIATGKPSGIVVIDLDGQQGIDSWIKLASEYGGAWDTYLVATPRGRHLYFHTDKHVPCSQGKLAGGIDVRGDGGYVVGPGSVVGDRGYFSDGGEIAELPDWLYELIRDKSDREAFIPGPVSIKTSSDYVINLSIRIVTQPDGSLKAVLDE